MARIVYVHKLSEQRSHGRRRLGQSERCFGCDTECAFRTDEGAEQVVTRHVDFEIDNVTAGKHDATTEYVIRCRAVLQTVNAARALRDVAAGGAAWLARRIRNVI